jgi:hypothetical protein
VVDFQEWVGCVGLLS